MEQIKIVLKISDYKMKKCIYTILNITIELEFAILPSLFLFSKPIEHFNSPIKKRTWNEIPFSDIDTIPTQIKKPISFISN